MSHPARPAGLPLEGAFLAAMLLALFGYPLLLRAPLCDPDEGIHATVAQEMVEHGDWITPRLLGEPFRDKPILYFWLQAASLATFGMSEAAVRLPGMLMAILGVLSTGLVGARLYGRTTGLVAAVIYGTMILPTALAQSPVHDVALVPCVNLSIVFFWEALQTRGWRRFVAGVAMGSMLGLAALAKGLPGVAVVGVAAVGYLLVDRTPAFVRLVGGSATVDDRQRLLDLWPLVVVGLLALLVALTIAAPWYLAAEQRDPGYLRYFFRERHLQGFVSATQLHGGRPSWYYLPFLLAGGVPAVLYLPAFARDSWSRGGLDRGAILLLAWLVGGTVLFSAASSKLPTYIWPVLPPLAVLAALPWSRQFAGVLAEPARRMLGASIMLACPLATLALPAAVEGCRRFADVHVPWLGWGIVAVTAPAFLVPLRCWWSRRYQECLVAGAAATVVQVMVFMAVVFPQLMSGFSARDLAAHFNAAARVPDHLVVLDGRAYSMIFYLTPPLRSTLHRGQVVMLDSRGAKRRPEVLDGAVCAVADGSWEKARSDLALDSRAATRVGHWRVFTLSAVRGDHP